MGPAVGHSCVQAARPECEPGLLHQHPQGSILGRAVAPPPFRTGACLHAARKMALPRARLDRDPRRLRIRAARRDPHPGRSGRRQGNGHALSRDRRVHLRRSLRRGAWIRRRFHQAGARDQALRSRRARQGPCEEDRPMTRRETVDVGGIPISYLTAGKGGPLVLLLHGTYWSRVWQPVLDGIAAAGLRPVAVDFPGFGRSRGELIVSEASVPRLSAWLVRFLEALGHKGPVMVAGHDIGGGVAQHLMLAGTVEVPRVAVVNGIMYDSWPVPGVARFRDPAVAAATTRDDVLAARRVSVVKALGRRLRNISIRGPTPGSLDPGWRWLALAGAAEKRYTQEMLLL